MISLNRQLFLKLKNINYNLIILVLGRLGVAIAGIVSVRISTSYLTPDQLGSLSQLVSFYTFFYTLLLIPISHYVTRGFLEWLNNGLIKKNIIYFILYMAFVSIVTIFVTAFLQQKFQIVYGFSVYYISILSGLAVFSTGINTFVTTSFNLLNKRVKYALISNLSVWLSIGLAAFLFIKKRNLAFWNLGQSIGLLIASFSIYLIWKSFDASVNSNSNSIPFKRKAILKFSWPIVVIAILWWIQSQSYRFILEKVSNISNVGFFVVGYNLASAPLAIYENIMTQYLQPIFYKDIVNQDSEGQARAWNSFARNFLPGLVVVGIFVSASSRYLANILLAEKFREMATSVCMIFALIEMMRVAGGMMYHLGIAKLDNRMTVLPVLSGAILAPVCVFTFSKVNPFYGTLLGLFIAGLVVLILIYIFSHKVLPVKWPIKEVSLAFLMSLPLYFIFYFFNKIFINPSFFFSFFVLILGFLYVILIMFKFRIIDFFEKK
jgi:O-antigen/teichoic acid export membrane protein